MREFLIDAGVFDRQHSEIAHEVFDLIVRHLRAEVFGSDFFNEVRFVKNHRGVVWKN